MSVFISYSHKDRKGLEMVRKHLKYLEEQRGLTIWDDRSIPPGARWREAIQQALHQTTVAVLLVSADFLASDFIMHEELPFLLQAAEEGHITLLSVVLSPCLFELTPLVDFQSFCAPLSLMSKGKREQTLSQIACAIAALLENCVK